MDLWSLSVNLKQINKTPSSYTCKTHKIERLVLHEMYVLYSSNYFTTSAKQGDVRAPVASPSNKPSSCSSQRRRMAVA